MVIVILISALAPVYALYLSFELHIGSIETSEISYSLGGDATHYETCIAEVVEAATGFARLEPVVGLSVVRDRTSGHRPLGEATLYDFLFTIHRR